MQNTVLVTGAAGFIGFHTTKALLKQGYQVIGIDNLNAYYDVNLKKARLAQLEGQDGFVFSQLDIGDLDGLVALNAEYGPFKKIVHLAAQAGVRYSLENPQAYIHSNILGHLNILELARHIDGFEHLVYASSSSVYGGNKNLPYSVKQSVDMPVSLYAATKRSDELMSHTYAHLYGIAQTGLRFFTVYGPWGRPDMAYYLFADAITRGKVIKIYNHGNMKRDFTYIDDIVEGILRALTSPPQQDQLHRVLNLGNHKSENLMAFVACLEDALGQKAEKELLPMQPGDVHETYADISETTAAIGYKPQTTIQQGLPQFVAWYKDYYKI